MANLGDLKLDVSIDKAALAQELRSFAALIDPIGQALAMEKDALQGRLNQWRIDYEKAAARRDAWKTRALEAEAMVARAGRVPLIDISLQEKYDREVAAHRGNVELLLEEQGKRLAAEAALKQMVASKERESARRIAAEEKSYALAKSFMDLHNVSKDVVNEVDRARKNEAALAQLSESDRALLGF